MAGNLLAFHAEASGRRAAGRRGARASSRRGADANPSGSSSPGAIAATARAHTSAAGDLGDLAGDLDHLDQLLVRSQGREGLQVGIDDRSLPRRLGVDAEDPPHHRPQDQGTGEGMRDHGVAPVEEAGLDGARLPAGRRCRRGGRCGRASASPGAPASRWHQPAKGARRSATRSSAAAFSGPPSAPAPRRATTRASSNRSAIRSGRMSARPRASSRSTCGARSSCICPYWPATSARLSSRSSPSSCSPRTGPPSGRRSQPASTSRAIGWSTRSGTTSTRSW